MSKANVEVDLSYLNDIAGGSAEFIIDMIDVFLEQTPLYFDQLNDAIQERNWKAIGDVAHKIKPTLAFMGVEEAKVQMEGVERKARAQENLEEIESDYNQLKSTCDSLYVSLRKIREEMSSRL